MNQKFQSYFDFLLSAQIDFGELSELVQQNILAAEEKKPPEAEASLPTMPDFTEELAQVEPPQTTDALLQFYQNQQSQQKHLTPTPSTAANQRQQIEKLYEEQMRLGEDSDDTPNPVPTHSINRKA